MEIGSQHTAGTAANTFADESQSDQITLLLKQLDNFERAPPTLLESWQKTQQAEYNSTARIFLDEGQFPAWLVYFLTKNAANKNSHFFGKAKLRQLINALEEQSVKSRQLLAAQIAAAIPPKHLEKINNLHKRTIILFQMSSNPKKRRRAHSIISENPPSPDATPQSAHGHHSSLGRTVQVPAHSAASSSCYGEDEGVLVNASLEQAENPKKKRRADSTISENPLGPDATPQSAHGHHSSLGRTVQVPAQSAASSSCYGKDGRVLVNASLEQAERLFPPDLFNSIKRYPDPRNKNIMVAAVSMSFPNEQSIKSKIPCQILLEVTEDKVLHLARDLFGARLEVKDGFRYLCSGRTKVMPSPKLTLMGCKRNVLSSTFGSETFCGIKESVRYQHEGIQLRGTTDSVGMVISASAQEGAVIYLSLGLWEGTEISNKLFE